MQINDDVIFSAYELYSYIMLWVLNKIYKFQWAGKKNLTFSYILSTNPCSLEFALNSSSFIENALSAYRIIWRSFRLYFNCFLCELRRISYIITNRTMINTYYLSKIAFNTKQFLKSCVLVIGKITIRTQSQRNIDSIESCQNELKSSI